MGKITKRELAIIAINIFGIFYIYNTTRSYYCSRNLYNSLGEVVGSQGIGIFAILLVMIIVNLGIIAFYKFVLKEKK